MKILEKDIKDVNVVGEIINRINIADKDFFDSESDVIFKRQPFVISLIMSYQRDLKPNVFEEMTKVVFIVWEYFKLRNKIKRKKITQTQFEKIELRNFQMLKYLEGESDELERLKVIDSDLDHLNSKALFAGIRLFFNTSDTFVKMDNHDKGFLLLDMKCLIECFEKIER